MASNLLYTIQEIAHKFSKYKQFKKLVYPLYNAFVLTPIIRHKNRKMKKIGLEALQQFNDCLVTNNVKYTLAFGTLLGAMREQGFIKHDLDIDVHIFADNYSDFIPKCLSKWGFNRIHIFLIEDGKYAREETYEYKGVSIDVFYLYKDDRGATYCCDFIPRKGAATNRESMKKFNSCIARKICIPVSENVVLQSFEGKKFYVPDNAHEILKLRYGNTYMTPNPKWVMSEANPNIVELQDKLAIYISI